jgi:hypothetical protein
MLTRRARAHQALRARRPRRTPRHAPSLVTRLPVATSVASDNDGRMESDASWPAPPPPEPTAAEPTAPEHTAVPPTMVEPATVEPATVEPTAVMAATTHAGPPSTLSSMPVEPARPRGRGALIAMSILAVVGIAGALIFGLLFMSKSSDNSDLEDELVASEADYADQSKQLADTKKTLTDTQGELANTKTSLDQTTERATGAEGKAADLETQLAAAKQRAQTAEDQAKTLNGQVDTLNGQVAEQTKRADTAEQTISDAKTQFLESFKNLVLSFENPMTGAQADCVGKFLVEHMGIDGLMLFVAADPADRAVIQYFNGRDACGVPDA